MYLIFNHSAHKRLWNWIANNPTCIKSQWPEWRINGGTFNRPHSYCFACETANNIKTFPFEYSSCSRQAQEFYRICFFCPLENKGFGSNVCTSSRGFRNWEDLVDYANLYMERDGAVPEPLQVEIVNCARNIRDWPLNQEILAEYQISTL